MPLKKAKPVRRTVLVDLTDAGYPDWQAVCRLDPPSREWDRFTSQDADQFWEALKAVVLEWNFVQDDGAPLPLPKDGLDYRDMPFGLLGRLVDAYLAAFRAETEPPKASDAPSAPTSPTDA